MVQDVLLSICAPISGADFQFGVWDVGLGFRVLFFGIGLRVLDLVFCVYICIATSCCSCSVPFGRE